MPIDYSSGPISAIVVHPDPAFRAVLKRLLAGAGAGHVDASETLEPGAARLPEAGPALVVLVMDGEPAAMAERLRVFARGARAFRAIVLLTPGLSPGVRPLFDAGASGFVEADAAEATLAAAIRTVFDGGVYLSPSIAAALFASGGNDAQTMAGLGLTMREKEVLALIAVNLSNKDIARKLGLSVRTVETHRFNIRKKTGAGNWRELAEIADRIGLLGDYRFAVQLAERIAAPGFHEE